LTYGNSFMIFILILFSQTVRSTVGFLIPFCLSDPVYIAAKAHLL
jgi:hypothetical protein